MTDVFSHMRNIAREEAQESKQLGFQERIVKSLLRYSAVPLRVGTASREAQDKYGSRVLGFQWFHAEFPQFPVRLLAQKLRHTHNTSLGDIYGRGQFRKLSWWREYEDQTALYGIDLKLDRAALFFNLPYAKDAFLMVLHNQPTQATDVVDAESRQDEPWPRTTFPMGKSGVVAVLESFPSFMQTVGKEWADGL